MEIKEEPINTKQQSYAPENEEEEEEYGEESEEEEEYDTEDTPAVQ